MKISIGFSPCPNDTFMFAAMVNHWIDTGGLQFAVHMEDIETLNEWADPGTLDITKMSFNKALHLEDTYHLLSAGAALGHGCGPLLISKKPVSTEAIQKGPIALPGLWTTAHLLFRIFYPKATNKIFQPFSIIEDLVAREEVVAGVIIHENRFTYEDKGLVKILDLGEAWEAKTGLPIPLGGIFASSRVPDDTRNKISALIRNSILYARSNPDRVMDYVRQYAQEMDETVMKSHIDLYVNNFSLDLGTSGLEAISFLKKNMA